MSPILVWYSHFFLLLAKVGIIFVFGLAAIGFFIKASENLFPLSTPTLFFIENSLKHQVFSH
jgi:hypothetical protein